MGKNKKALHLPHIKKKFFTFFFLISGVIFFLFKKIFGFTTSATGKPPKSVDRPSKNWIPRLCWGGDQEGLLWFGRLGHSGRIAAAWVHGSRRVAAVGQLARLSLTGGGLPAQAPPRGAHRHCLWSVHCHDSHAGIKRPSLPTECGVWVGTSMCKGDRILSYYFFLATPRSMWDLSSLTRNWTLSLGSKSTEHWAPDCQGSSQQDFKVESDF